MTTNVIFSTLDNGARDPREVPYISVTVDLVRVRFIDRPTEGFTGWRCDECGDGRCRHSEQVWPFLGSKIRQRIRRAS